MWASLAQSVLGVTWKLRLSWCQYRAGRTCGMTYGRDSGMGGSSAVGTAHCMTACLCCCRRYDMTMWCSLDIAGGRDSRCSSRAAASTCGGSSSPRGAVETVAVVAGPAGESVEVVAFVEVAAAAAAAVLAEDWRLRRRAAAAAAAGAACGRREGRLERRGCAEVRWAAVVGEKGVAGGLPRAWAWEGKVGAK